MIGKVANRVRRKRDAQPRFHQTKQGSDTIYRHCEYYNPTKWSGIIMIEILRQFLFYFNNFKAFNNIADFNIIKIINRNTTF